MAFDSLSDKLQNIFKKLRGKGRLNEDDVKAAMKEVKMALLEADVNFKVVKQFVNSVTERAIGQDVMQSLTPGQMVIKIVNEEMVSLMGSETTEIAFRKDGKPTVIMMVGLQGAGKTTTTAKIAGKLKEKGKRPLLVACDVYRPAAIKQLQINGEKQEVPVFDMGENNKPVDIAKAAIAHAEKNGNKVVIIDTAGRLHVDEDMMNELKDIKENGRAYTIDYTVEPTGVESFIHSFADEVTTPATPASFTVHYPEKSTKTNAYDTSNLGLVGEEAKKAGLGADRQAITDPRDVFFDFTEPVDGYGVDVDALMATVRTRCESKDFGDIEVAMAPIHSDVTVEKLKESLFLRGTASTTYKSKRRNTNRCHNLEKACGMVYGTVLQPGEEFSANTILGDRTLSNGWKPAPAVIAGGADHEDQPGGGVCQIASTTYMAVLYGDFEVTARRPHSTPSGYPNGLDATINTVTGYIDFKWKNNTESPCYVFTWIDTKNYTVNCSIYGQPFPDTFDEIELSSTLVEPLEPGVPEYEVKNSLYSPYWMLKNKAVKGSIYESFKTYKLKGKVVQLTVRGGENGKLFGSITSADIAEAVKEQSGADIDKKKIQLDSPIKQVGDFEVPVKLFHEVSAVLKVKTVAE